MLNTEKVTERSSQSELLAMTTEIVSAHVANNQVPVGDLADLIKHVYSSLASQGQPATPEAERPVPAVPIKKSVMPDYIICLEDGKRLTMLKRHLQSRYNMSPSEYRTKWGLPDDYPMVAPAYAERRSVLAKEIGLGRKPMPAPEPEPAPAAKRRPRKKAGE